jgi:membrane protease YdiL (CAAX protease family)
MTECTLVIIDYWLLAAGGVVIVSAVVWWWLDSRSFRRARGLAWRDPLRGSPLRANRLSLVHAWVCIVVTLFGWVAFGQVAAWIAPDLKGEPLVLWQGIFAANVTAVLNTSVCLLVARATFARGLHGFGIHRRRLSYDLLVGVAGWLAALCLTNVIGMGTQWLIRWFYPTFQQPEHGVFKALRDPTLAPWMQVFTVIGTAFLVPVGEEVLFRGILQTGMQKVFPARWGSLVHRWAAIFVVGTLFGTIHTTTPQYVPALIALGILLGFLYERTGSLIVPILVHMLFNGKSLLWDYLARS